MEEQKETWAKRLRNGLLAIVCMVFIAGFVYSSINKQEVPETQITLTYDNAISYKIEGDSLNLNTRSLCKAIESTVTYDAETGVLRFQFEGNPPVLYSDGHQGLYPGQLVVTNQAGVFAVYTRGPGDSILVIVERPYFIILSKGKECVNFEDLPILSN